jgi:hypothetical protein
MKKFKQRIKIKTILFIYNNIEWIKVIIERIEPIIENIKLIL